MKTRTINSIIVVFCALFVMGTANAQTLELNSVPAQTGDQVSVTLSTPDGLLNVGAISLYIYTDENVLTFQDITIINTAANGMLAAPVNNMIGLSWIASGFTGVDFTPGDILTLNFNVTGCGDVALDFNQAICEVVDFDVNPIMVTYFNGGVQMAGVPIATWTGNADQDWTNPANWDGGAVPSCNTDVTIPPAANYPMVPASKAIMSVATLTMFPGAALTVSGSLTVNNDLIIMSDATGTASVIDNGALVVLGNTLVDRYYAVDKWHLISSPLGNGQAGIYQDMYLQLYDEPSASWFDIIPPTDPLIPAQGYALWVPYMMTTTYPGILNSGLVSVPVSAANPFGWNLLGNPYPSSLDWMLVAGANPAINGAVYYLDAASGMFVSFNGGMGGGSAYVPPMQGFFVSANTTGVFNVDNTMRTHAGQNMYYKNDFSNMLALAVDGNGYEDVTYMRFDEEATPGFDGQYDAYKMFSWFNDEAPQIYQNAGENQLSINVLPETEVIPVGFSAGVNGTYEISIREVKDLDYVVLEDLKTGIETDLLSGPYSFEYDVNENAERFVLHFGPLAIDELTGEFAQVYAYNSDVCISIPAGFSGEAAIFDIMGQEIARFAVNSGLNKVTLETSGYYLVKVYAEGSMMTEKVYVK